MDQFDKSQIEAAASRVILSFLPGGGIITELFELRGKIRQERILNFIVSFAGFLGHNPDINTALLKEEDFIDLFEAVIRRVALTKSQDKHQRFKDLLINYIQTPSQDIDDVEVFLDLVKDLGETSILILNAHLAFDKTFSDKQQEKYRLEKLVSELKTELDKQKYKQDQGYVNDVPSVLTRMHDANTSILIITTEIDSVQIGRKAEYYRIQESTFLYHKQILAAKGLLSDNHTGNFIGGKTLTYMSLTEFGERFIRFIVNS